MMGFPCNPPIKKANGQTKRENQKGLMVSSDLCCYVSKLKRTNKELERVKYNVPKEPTKSDIICIAALIILRLWRTLLLSIQTASTKMKEKETKRNRKDKKINGSWYYFPNLPYACPKSLLTVLLTVYLPKNPLCASSPFLPDFFSNFLLLPLLFLNFPTSFFKSLLIFPRAPFGRSGLKSRILGGTEVFGVEAYEDCAEVHQACALVLSLGSLVRPRGSSSIEKVM